jgi:hypothetical protein
MRALAGVFAGCALGLAAQAATFVQLQSQPGDPTAGGAQHLEYDGARTETNGTKTYVMTVTPNAAGGVDFLRTLPCGEFCFNNGDFTSIQFAPAAGQSFGVGTYSQAQRFSKTPGSRPGLFADEQGRDVDACATITGSYTVLELQRAADGTILRFAADFEQHCKGQPAALYAGVRFNSDVPYVQAVGFSTGSIRYKSDTGDPIGLAVTDAFVVRDGHTATTGSTRNTVHLELQTPGGAPLWALTFSAPNNEAVQVGPYGTAVLPRTSPDQPSLQISNGANTCAANTSSVLVYEIAWSAASRLERFAADIMVTCAAATGSLTAGVRYNSTVPYVPASSSSAAIDLPEGTVNFSAEGTTDSCVMGQTAVFYPAMTQSPLGLPKYIAAPYGALDFHVEGCGFSRAAIFTFEAPNPLPPTAQWWKFGASLDNPTPHWHVIPSQVDGNRISFTVIDGDVGDSDLSRNGKIHDFGLLGIPGGMFQDLWWAGAVEDGWGMSIVQHGDVLFTNLFVYDANGAPTWYVMPGGSWDASHTAFHGNVYLPKGSPYFAYDVSKFNIGAALGSATITFADANTATLDYTISGASGHKNITRIPFGPDGPPTDQPMGDLWWGGVGQNGWGLAVLQQVDTLFMLWFTYDANGNATWFAMPSGQWSARNDYRGTLFKSAGAPWLGVPYDASRHTITAGGTFRFLFGGDTATFSYTLDGRNGSIPLSRIPF